MRGGGRFGGVNGGGTRWWDINVGVSLTAELGGLAHAKRVEERPGGVGRRGGGGGGGR